ncbi:ComEA family DNA-binding protein [Flavobacterium sp.]|jgi:DNA uptake protein ComE-like DNA-binding protein|uniref:ComEA family DNA-binding protein n=1 Tax=Flavobacterium sp. TaxID=239 RepID=UPI0037C12FDD
MLRFSKGHYFGIAILICSIGLLQLFIYWFNNQKDATTFDLTADEKNWLLAQNEIDSLKEAAQENSNKIYPFNPNFISDYKGYKLGMSETQIDKLHQFRKQNKYVNSNAEFQKLTGVSNEWMEQYAPYFKFPEWVTNRTANNYQTNYDNTYQKFDKKETKIVVQDLNKANQAELEKAYMIGEKLALKIISERDKFGSFASMEQLGFIWGISPEAIADLNKKFQIRSSENLKKININTSTIKELQQFPYFNYTIAKNIVTFRSMNGDFKSSEDLTTVKQFPLEKLKIIALYLEF